MPEDSTPTQGGSGGKISQFIKKNKTLSAVLGLGGLYFVYKELKKGSGGTVEAEPIEGAGTYLGPNSPTSVSNEGTDEEINRAAEELRQEREDRENMESENTESHVEGSSPEANQPSEAPAAEGPHTEGGGGISIHGKEFQGATSYRIAKTGKTEGGKSYIEYAVTFPGRQEHWQYFTATGNWRQVKSSAGGPGSPKPPTPTPKPHTPGGGGNPQPKPEPKPKPKPKPPAPGIGPGHPVPTPPPPPPVVTEHPKAVNTGNRCVNGGVGPHTAPAGYHLFCGSDGWIYRAPNN
jgi:hypothetical protein